MTGSPNSPGLLLVFLIALLLLVSCTDEAEEEGIAEELVVDSPAATGAMRGGLTFELPKPGHSKADCLPVFAENIENPAEGE